MRSNDNERITANMDAVTLFSPVEYVEKILIDWPKLRRRLKNQGLPP
ncbi:MAG TPA: hypothetical protein VND64_03125 [Pirellulales bacterium]|nr:hypothetical protein [Pirellulales bacterium]